MPILEPAADRYPTRRLLVNGWCKRAAVLGLVFSIPSALGAQVSAWSWTPDGAAAIALVGGLLIALGVYALVKRKRTPEGGRSPVWERPGGAGASAVRQRLAEEKARLEDLDAERACRGDSAFGKATEERIIWGELLDLELQDIDEQVGRIRRGAERRSS